MIVKSELRNIVGFYGGVKRFVTSEKAAPDWSLPEQCSLTHSRHLNSTTSFATSITTSTFLSGLTHTHYGINSILLWLFSLQDILTAFKTGGKQLPSIHLDSASTCLNSQPQALAGSPSKAAIPKQQVRSSIALPQQRSTVVQHVLHV